MFLLHCTLAAAQCIVIGPDCGFVCLWVCYHDNSKLRESNLTELGLQVKVVTISSWLNFGRPAPPGRGSAVGRNIWLRLTTASAQCLRSLWALFSYLFLWVKKVELSWAEWYQEKIGRLNKAESSPWELSRISAETPSPTFSSWTSVFCTTLSCIGNER